MERMRCILQAAMQCWRGALVLHRSLFSFGREWARWQGERAWARKEPTSPVSPTTPLVPARCAAGGCRPLRKRTRTRAHCVSESPSPVTFTPRLHLLDPIQDRCRLAVMLGVSDYGAARTVMNGGTFDMQSCVLNCD